MILSETYTLKDSLTIPKFGLGTWLIDDKSTAEAVRKAIGLGYRLIDTAQAYGNERGVGEGVRTASVPREDIFITSKIAAELKDYESASKSIDETLNKMGLDYIDMMLIHSPQPWKEVNQSENRCLLAKREVWKALEDAYDEGKVKAIGVANFLEEDLMNILENCRIRPMVDQLLCHVGNTPFGVIDFCKKENILVEAYSSIAHGASPETQGHRTHGKEIRRYHRPALHPLRPPARHRRPSKDSQPGPHESQCRRRLHYFR